MPRSTPRLRRSTWRIEQMSDDRSTAARDGGGNATARQYPPRMTRSQPQLATSYAPGAMFTWEGGKGACIAVPIDGPTIDFSAGQTRIAPILASLVESCHNWPAHGTCCSRNTDDS